ncbi:hypothetical protein [Psychrobacillus sp.]|uniref:hypothetical protein n=1 Tax=Psychrobacillus sp. TaxID=1871623 RepID=UPI0028BDC432|nr:hypothetical protein [Psychrobacillus sp.]
MDYNELIKLINISMDNLDLVSARRYMEQNMDVLDQNRHLLRSNARALFNFLKKEQMAGVDPLSRKDITIIYSINKHATKFDIRGLKLSINNHAELLAREDIKYYLNDDAKILLESMNVINKKEKELTFAT